MKIKALILCFLIGLTFPAQARVVDYQLHIRAQDVHLAGECSQGLTINNTIPGPVLRAKVHDILRVTVFNHLTEETSIHWHGVLVPNRMDGVPYITTPPIKPGASFVYEFPIKHAGTYWYHAHSGLQEQKGVYGALVFDPEQKQDPVPYDAEHVIVLSDWTNEDPNQVLANLKKDADYYALKKDTVQSWDKVLGNGARALELRFKNAWQRIGPMDMSDIAYDAFLANGKKAINLTAEKPGSRLKLRIINAAASTYFVLEYAGGPMTVVEADGLPIQPLSLQRLKMAMAETYDVIVTIPEPRTYELRATAEDGTGFTSAYLGQGPTLAAPTLPKPNLLLMDMTQGHQGHSDDTQDYYNIKSIKTTTLPKGPEHAVTLRLTGRMERYVWTINDTPMYASDKIHIQKGENVRFKLINDTVMNHPIHVHGHFFRVLNGQGDHSPLKHTVNVPAFQTVEIEFLADAEKDWIFHCHNLYHMKLGMGGVIHYTGSIPDADIMGEGHDHSPEHGNEWFGASHFHAYSNFAATRLRATRNDDVFVVSGRHNYRRDGEGTAYYERYISPFFGVYAGGELERERQKRTGRGIFGAHYTLPLFLESDLRIDTKGKVRFGISNEHQLMNRLSCHWTWNTDKEYTLDFHYEISKNIYISGNYDSREQFGVGMVFKL